MQFGPNVVDEIVIPNNVPFAPGNNVIGIGTEIPPELVAVGFDAALVFYFSNWDPTSTTPLVKYAFIAPISNGTGSAVSIGFGICNNPSVSQTPVVVTGWSIEAGNEFTGHMTISENTFNHLATAIAEVTEGNTGGDGAIAIANNAGTHNATKIVTTTSGAGSWTGA